MMLAIRPQDQDIIVTILRRYLPANSQVWVFGSRARGNPKPYSDLDLAIALNDEPLSAQLLADLAYAFEESDLPYKVDIVDWNSISESFQAHIRTDLQLLNL